MYRTPLRAPAAALLLLAAGACDLIERARGGERAPETLSANAGPLTLGLHTPGALNPGEEGIIRLSLANRGDTAAHAVRVELQVPEWMEPMPPRPGDPAVTLSAPEEGHTRFAYRLDDTLGAGQTRILDQRVRVAPPRQDGAIAWSRVVRARLLSPTGEVLAEIESEVGVIRGSLDDSAAAPPPPAAAAEPRDRLGPLQLGAAAAALRQAGARDTTWSQEGMEERGLLVAVQDGRRALAVLAGDTVSRIEVRDPAIRTREGVGVGSTLGELRAAYGPGCAGAGDGIVAVWFPAAPGISFQVDAPLPAGAGRARDAAERIPPTARVSRWWLRRGTDRC